MAQDRVSTACELLPLVVGAAAVHAEVEFIGIALGGFLSEDLEAGFFVVVVFGTERVILEVWFKSFFLFGGKEEEGYWQ